MRDAWLGRLFLRFRERGDGRALAAVFDATARELIAVAGHLVPRLDLAEDVVQTTFQRAIEHADRFDASRSLKAWLYGILWREAAKTCRQEARRVDPDAVTSPRAAEPAESAAAAEVPEAVRAALGRVASPYREVLEPILVEERSTREVAERLGRAPGTVRVQLQRGLERLRRELPLGLGRPEGGGTHATLGVGLTALRERVLGKAGIAAGAVPAASAVFLLTQTALVAATPPVVLGATALSVAAGVAALQAAGGPGDDGAASVSAPRTTSLAAPRPSPGARGMREAESLREASAPPTGRREERPPSRPEREEDAETLPQVVGLVVDTDDRPVAGVTVNAEGENHYGFESTTSDAEGRFAFADLAPGRWYFAAEDERYARMWWRTHFVTVPDEDEENDDPEPRELRLVLQPPATLEGHVIDEAGAPVEAVRIVVVREWPRDAERPLQGHFTQELVETHSGPDGGYALERTVAGRLMLVLEHEAFAPTMVEVESPARAHPLVILRGMTLEGRVVTPEGAPVVGARIEAHTTRQAQRSMGDWDVRTDAGGHFRIERVAAVGDRSRLAGVPTVSVRAAGDQVSAWYKVHESAGGLLPFVEIIAVPRGEETGPAIEVGRDLAAEARAAGRPWGDAALRVRVDSASEVQRVRLRSDSEGLENVVASVDVSPEGTCSFQSLLPGTYVVTAYARSGPNLAPVRVELSDGEVLEVALRAGTTTLRGRITCRGRAVAGDVLVARGLGRLAHTGQSRGDWEADGTYAFEGLDPGDYEVVLQAPGGLAQHFDVRVEQPGTVLDLELPPGRIEGRLVDVDMPAELDHFEGVAVFPYGWYQESGNRGIYLHPDADGRFEARHLPPGDWVVSVPQARNFVPARVVHLSAGAPHATVELSGTTVAATLAGRVVGGGTLGKRELGIAALRREPQGLRRTGYAEVEPDGSFSLIVEPGEYGLLVTAFGSDAPFTWVPHVTASADASAPLEIRLPPARRVRLRLEPGDARLAIWSLRMPDGDRLGYTHFVGSEPEGRWNPRGDFSLPLGSYVVEVDFGDGAPVRAPLEVVPGTEPLEITVARPGGAR